MDENEGEWKKVELTKTPEPSALKNRKNSAPKIFRNATYETHSLWPTQKCPTNANSSPGMSLLKWVKHGAALKTLNSINCFTTLRIPKRRYLPSSVSAIN